MKGVMLTREFVDKLPRHVVGEMTHDAKKLKHIQNEETKLGSRTVELKNELRKLTERRIMLSDAKMSLLTKTYDMEGHVSSSEDRLRELLANRFASFVKRTMAEEENIVKYQVQKRPASDNTVSVISDIEVCGPLCMPSFSDYLFESLIEWLASKGISPYVSAKARFVIVKDIRNGKISIEHFRSDKMHTIERGSEAEGALPNPHFYQYSCLGDWSSIVYSADSVEDIVKSLSMALRSINFSEDAQFAFLRSTDLEQITKWTYIQNDEKEIFDGSFSKLIEHIDPENRIKETLCEKCREDGLEYVIVGPDGSNNPIAKIFRNMPEGSCRRGCPFSCIE